MSILDKPLTVIFPELNSLQINMIRELMKREYERGKNETATHIALALANRDNLTISEPTTTQYTANAEPNREVCKTCGVEVTHGQNCYGGPPEHFSHDITTTCLDCSANVEVKDVE
jgi:hypothetical protein